MIVSILITTYNCENYIDDAISSVVNQEMPFQWELLVGDDGSNDNTQAIINRWVQKYPNEIKLFIMERESSATKNGTRAARNRANLLEKSTGDYIIFLDGDDKFLGTEKLKKQVSLLENDSSHKYACVAHNIMAYNIKENKKYPLIDESIKEGAIDSFFYWKNMYFHTNTILFRSCCKKMMLNPKYRDFLNDNFITYIILQYGQIYYLDEVWAQYNLTGDGLWTGKKRTHGCFRNLIIYDLQLRINRKFAFSSFIRHLYDFRYIFKFYELEDREKIDSLLKELDEKDFHYTFLMYKNFSELKLGERIEKIILKFRVNVIQLIRRSVNVIKKLLRKEE